MKIALLALTLTLFGRASEDPEKPTDAEALKQWQQIHDQTLVLAEQQKLLTAQQGIFKQYLPTLPKGVTPGLERKGDTSVIAIAAAHTALEEAAIEIAQNVKGVQANELGGTPKYSQIWLHGQNEAKALAQLPVFQTQLKSVLVQLQKTLEEIKPEEKPKAAAAAVEALAVLPTVAGIIGPLVETAFGIAELFRTNVTITSHNVTAAESAITAMVAGKLRDKATAGQVYSASEFPLAIIQKGGILDDLTELRSLMGKLILALRTAQSAATKADSDTTEKDGAATDADAKVKMLTARRDRQEEFAAMSPSPEQRAYWDKVKGLTEDALTKAQADLKTKKADADAARKIAKDKAADAKRLQDVVDKVNEFQNTLYTKADDDTALAKILRLEAIAAKWAACDEKCGALQVVVHALGTDTKEEANYFGQHEKGSGAAIVSYALYQAKTSSLWYGGEARKTIEVPSKK